jgi:nucleoside-diphosphate-sugar epimerase
LVTPRTALVTGASGVVGRALVAHLAAQPDWRVIALSRRRPTDFDARVVHVAVDLAQADATRAALARHGAEVTHAFACAYAADADPDALITRNVALLDHLLDALDANAPRLAHVQTVAGTKWYGSHLGPFRTPAKESQPRHPGRNFYFDQQDRLAARADASAGRWTWSAVRPHAVCGFSLASPMNLVLVLATYASICKALGVPFAHPGAAANRTALYQCCDAGLLARAMTHVATTPACANAAFNVTNGDLFRWGDVWPTLAACFDVEDGGHAPRSLVEFMADKGPVWDALVARHGLKPHALHDLAHFAFGDFVFRSTWDIASDTGRLRRSGFAECLDSEAMFVDHFEALRAARVIP